MSNDRWWSEFKYRVSVTVAAMFVMSAVVVAGATLGMGVGTLIIKVLMKMLCQ